MQINNLLAEWKQLRSGEGHELIFSTEIEHIRDLVRQIDALVDLFEIDTAAAETWLTRRAHYCRMINDLTEPLAQLRERNWDVRDILLVELGHHRFDISQLDRNVDLF